MITVYTCYYREKLRLSVLKSFQPIINLVFEFNNTIESSLRILYFTPNFTDMLFSLFDLSIFFLTKSVYMKGHFVYGILLRSARNHFLGSRTP